MTPKERAWTPEELDEARAREAHTRTADRQQYTERLVIDTATLAARLAREGWTPPDPDLIEAREVLAAMYPEIASSIRNGFWDEGSSMRIALAAIKRGRELERAALSRATGTEEG